MSARTAAATPGYWTLTATSAAVGERRPVHLADRGRRDRLLVELVEHVASGSPSSCSITLRMSLKVTFGAASRSAASLRWNSSRYSSGTMPTSRNDITCPTFIAAPFIVPSASTICSAASMLAALERRLPPLLACGPRSPRGSPPAGSPVRRRVPRSWPCAPHGRWGSCLRSEQSRSAQASVTAPSAVHAPGMQELRPASRARCRRRRRASGPRPCGRRRSRRRAGSGSPARRAPCTARRPRGRARARCGRNGCARARRRPSSVRCARDGSCVCAGSASSVSMIDDFRSA